MQRISVLHGCLKSGPAEATSTVWLADLSLLMFFTFLWAQKYLGYFSKYSLIHQDAHQVGVCKMSACRTSKGG